MRIFEALHGTQPDFDSSESEESFVFEPQGCQGEGFREVGGPGDMMRFYEDVR